MLEKLKKFLFKNTTEKQTVAKNTVWLTISNFGGRIIKAAVVIYAARVLGTAGYGVFSYAITLAGFLTLFMDPGVNGILMRDASKSDDKGQREIFSTMFVVKIALVVIGLIIVLFIAPSFSTLPGARAILPIVAIILILDTLREFFTALLRAQERMEWDAGIFLLTNLGILVFGFMFLAIRTTPKSFAWAYVAGDLIGIALAAVIIRTYFKTIVSHFNLRRIGPILNAAWPFAVTGALGTLFTSADILIISWIKTASDVGIYSAAIRIIQLFYLIPVVFQYSTLPLLARLVNHDNARFRAGLERTISLVFLISVPLALGGAILGTQIMSLVFGPAYASGGLAFKILMLTMLVDYPATILVTAIFAYDRQKSLIFTSLIGGAANVILDLALIPRFGMVGSAVATLIAAALSNWYLWHMMKKINYFEVIPKLKAVFISGIIMALATVLLLFLHVNVLVNVAISAVIYCAALLALREPLLGEMKSVIQRNI